MGPDLSIKTRSHGEELRWIAFASNLVTCVDRRDAPLTGSKLGGIIPRATPKTDSH
jgi:hypothetical protein